MTSDCMIMEDMIERATSFVLRSEKRIDCLRYQTEQLCQSAQEKHLFFEMEREVKKLEELLDMMGNTWKQQEGNVEAKLRVMLGMGCDLPNSSTKLEALLSEAESLLKGRLDSTQSSKISDLVTEDLFAGYRGGWTVDF